MSQEITNLQPQAIWNNFFKLTQIPRPSKKEGKIIAFMENWAKERNLQQYTDKIGNVIISKPATKGKENLKTVILQAHLDMVPQKNNDVEHDFEKDPIQAYVDGDWVTAKGTTLGADNGMGVAAAMAVLESNDIEHGPIEALFTIDEETGMTGAFNLEPNVLKGDILLNLDSEDEGELYIGCAGGVDTTLTLKLKRKEVPENSVALKINVGGLKGGHSGMDIPLQRANSNKVLFRMLYEAMKNFKIRLSSVQGGNMRNAIPRESEAVIVVDKTKADALKAKLEEIGNFIKVEFQKTDAGLTIKIEDTELPKNVIKNKHAKKLINLVQALPHGPIRFMDDVPNVPETSVNLAIVETREDEAFLASLLRSSIDASKEFLQKDIESIAMLAGAEYEHSGKYPGWKPRLDSPILETMKNVYKDKFGKTPEVKIIHAGLECGILGSTYTNWDMISFGPTIRFPHSPDEKVNIETVQMFWDYLVETLKNIPAK